MRLRDRNGCRVPGCQRRRYVEGDADGELVFYDRDGKPIASPLASQCGTSPGISASADATTLLTLIGGRGGWSVDALCEASGLPVRKVVVALVELQLAGRVREDPCGYRAKAA